MIKGRIFNQAKQENRFYLTEIEAKEILKEARIPVVDTKLANSKKDAITLSRGMGFPVVMKIVSPDIIHKTDSGGVRLNIRNTTEAGNSYGEILSTVRKKHPGVRIEGVSVQKMVSRGVELIIGVTKDAQFGPVLMFGLGGIFVEVLKDVSFKIIPLTRKDAQDMIKEIKGYPVLGGFRGQEAVSIPILEDVILKVSEFVDTNPEIKELDINPIFAYKEGATAVDARIILEPMARDSL